MLIYSHAAWTICFGVLLNCSMIEAKSISWLSRFIKYVRRNAQINQVVILNDGEGKRKNFAEERIVQKITNRLPTIKFTFQEATEERALKLNQIPSFEEPRATSLMVIIHLSNENQILSRLAAPIGFVSRIAEGRSRPKCLFILPRDGEGRGGEMRGGEESYEQLLRQMWARQFLDVTVLELATKDDTDASPFQDLSYKAATMNYLNPFLNTCKKVRYSSRLPWFPDKTRNLHRYELKVGGPAEIPTLYFALNRTGHSVRALGSVAIKAQALAKAMNFEIAWKGSKEHNLGRLSCDRNKSTGYFHNLENNEVNFLARTLGRIRTCAKVNVEWSRGTYQKYLTIVVPTIPNELYSFSLRWKLFSAIGIFGFIVLSWLLTRLLRFEDRNWQLLYFVQVVLGWATPRDPRKVAERIYFGSLLLCCMLNATYIYSAFTNTSLQKTAQIKMETIRDVRLAGLRPLLDPSLFFSLYNNSDGDFRRLLDKSIKTNISSKQCLTRLAKQKNISCIVSDAAAQSAVEKSMTNGQPALMVINEYLMSMPSGYILERRSPYIESFDRLILTFTEAGLTQKWKRKRFGGMVVSSKKENVTKGAGTSKMRVRQLAQVLAAGYLCSIVAFGLELLVSYFRSGQGVWPIRNCKNRIFKTCPPK